MPISLAISLGQALTLGLLENQGTIVPSEPVSEFRRAGTGAGTGSAGREARQRGQRCHVGQ